MVFSFDFDISFICSLYIISRAFKLEIEGVAVESSRGSIIKDSLVRDIDIEDRAKDKSSFSCTQSKRDIESEDESENIRGVMDFTKVNRRFIRG